MKDRVMKERPIIFSSPMVRAILEGRKTQTRRPIKPTPLWEEYPSFEGGSWGGRYRYAEEDSFAVAWHIVKCPYGHVGDRLWVREVWFNPEWEAYEYKNPHTNYYRATDDPSEWKWKPSIHMPRWASRITLEILDIQIERVQEITEGDAWSEGFPAPQGQNIKYTDRARYWFKTLWNTIYAKKQEYSWDADPWVWVIEFQRLAKPEGE